MFYLARARHGVTLTTNDYDNSSVVSRPQRDFNQISRGKQAQILREKHPPISAERLLDLSRIPVGQKRSHAFVRSSRSSAG